MRGIRVGQGVDVHPRAHAGSGPLVLAGVEVPSAWGLAGHSDADVVCHALVDALLGAAALGDIGTLVGVDLDTTSGASSRGFLRMAVERLRDAGWAVGNVDVTVIAEEPRLAPYRAAMRQALASDLGVDPSAVSVKATTTDRLGMLGRGEGIGALAVALVHALEHT